MGASYSVTNYAAEVTAPADPHEETGIYRSIDALKAIVNLPPGKISTVDMLEETVKRLPDGPMLGYRAGQEYKWYTYQRVWDLAMQVGCYMKDFNLAPKRTFPDEVLPMAQSLSCIGIFMVNCPEWFISEFAAASQSFTLVPLYDTLGEESLMYICSSTQIKTIIVNPKTFGMAIKAAKECPKILDLIVVGSLSPEEISQAQTAGVSLHFWDAVISSPVRSQPNRPTNPDQINTICYTSGTTGMPKGVLLSHRNVYGCAYATNNTGPLSKGFNGVTEVKHTDCHISYLPLAHVFERLVCNVVFIVGAQVGCFGGDMRLLMDDIAVLNPTVFVSVPRLFNRINDKISEGVGEKGAIVQSLFNYGMDTKINKFRNQASTSSTIWDRVVFSQFQNKLGNRLRFMISGGAPLDPKVHERMQACFSAPILQGYGMSETMGPAFICSPSDTVVGHVGGVYTTVEFKLKSVPELGYYADGEVTEGELLLRGTSVCQGYFQNKEANDEIFDNGWLCTGDICALLPSQGVKIIDRKKNLFKLAQGEYVAPEKIENTLGNCKYVNQIFVHGTSLESYLIAVVSVEKSVAMKWGAENNQTDFDTICGLLEFRKEVVKSLGETATQDGLHGFEKIRNLICVTHEFTVENNLQTPTSKLKRAVAQKHFKSELDALYAEGPLKL